MADRQMARADLVTGTILFVLSVAVIYGAWTMDRLDVRQIHPLSAPGLTPGLLGVALAVTSVTLIFKAVRGAPARAGPVAAPVVRAGEDAGGNPGAIVRLTTATALCLAYALGLVGRMPFWLATAIFVTAFIAIFEWEFSTSRANRIARLGWALCLGLATGIIVSYAFRDLFLVRLP
jgi:hypothetical protein